MPYGPDRSYPLGKTFCYTLSDGEVLTFPPVLEDGVIFTRFIRFSVGLPDTTAACLVSGNGGTGEQYFWRVTAVAPPYATDVMELSFSKGSSGRITCNGGMVLTSWRERYEMVQ